MTSYTQRPIVVGCIALLLCTSTFAQGFIWDDDDARRLTDAILADTYGQVSSLWIEQKGRLIYERYFHGADPDTLHNMRSAGKSVTGALIGAAIDDGIIEDVNVKAASFFDDLRPFENPDRRKDEVTLKDLLTMSGPLECDDWNSFSRGNEERMYLVEDWSAFFWNLPIKNRPSWEIPDDDGGFDRIFTYCTAGVQLLGEILERTTGETAAAFASRRLFGPSSVTGPKWNYASSGKAHLGGGLELTTADWARVARLYLDRGRAGNEQILSEAWIDASFTDYVKIDEQTSYGYLWWRPQYVVAGKTYTANMMSGSGGNRVYVLPEFQMVVIITKSDFRDRDAHPKSDRLFADEVASRLSMK